MHSASAAELNPTIEPSCPVAAAAPAASPKPRKPRVWTVFVAWIVAAIVGEMAIFASLVVVGASAGMVLGAQGADAATIQAHVQAMFQQPLLALLVRLLPFQLTLAAVVLLAAWLSKEPLAQRLGLVKPSGRTFGGLQLAGMAAFTMAAATSVAIAMNLLLGAPAAGNAIDAVITDGSWWTITLLSLVLCMIPAVIEEIVFRGYIQRRFLQRWSPAVAIGVSSLLFALLHADSLPHIVAVVPLAVVTGLLAYRTNSVRPGMLVHAVHNAGAVGFGVLATVLVPHFGQDTAGLLTLGAIAVLGLAGLPAVVSLLRSAKPRPAHDAHFVPQPATETPSVLGRELGLAGYLTDSRVAG
jgi:membrane protease YdiL (CAAX protease family)